LHDKHFNLPLLPFIVDRCVWNSLVVSKHAELHNISFTVVHGGVYRLTEWERKQRVYRDVTGD